LLKDGIPKIVKSIGSFLGLGKEAETNMHLSGIEITDGDAKRLIESWFEENLSKRDWGERFEKIIKNLNLGDIKICGVNDKDELMVIDEKGGFYIGLKSEYQEWCCDPYINISRKGISTKYAVNISEGTTELHSTDMQLGGNSLHNYYSEYSYWNTLKLPNGKIIKIQIDEPNRAGKTQILCTSNSSEVEKYLLELGSEKLPEIEDLVKDVLSLHNPEMDIKDSKRVSFLIANVSEEDGKKQTKITDEIHMQNGETTKFLKTNNGATVCIEGNIIKTVCGNTSMMFKDGEVVSCTQATTDTEEFEGIDNGAELRKAGDVICNTMGTLVGLESWVNNKYPDISKENKEVYDFGGCTVSVLECGPGQRVNSGESRFEACVADKRAREPEEHEV